MGNGFIRFPHSNCEARTGGFVDILEECYRDLVS